MVYLAEQSEPIRRRVAVKVIKLGMDTKQVIARFESERQALALMNHSNIARVLEAGEDLGRPYFVMEYIAGISITEYCDKHRLSARERLELFIPVCREIQHAHQKGIIHRDIKPSNVLVEVQGKSPIPKIIDFGVAKATAQRLTEKTVFTQQGILIGPPAYMSPEQSEMTQLDIDTRTDIYSLGVLLYELLVGSPPSDTKALLKAGFDEMRRILREEDPPTLTTRLSGLGDTASEVATRRHTDVASLKRQLSGDLDWITQKAMEKDRIRRYESASELVTDIGRYFNQEPVLAIPPSTAYRASKFVRRHRALVASVLTVVLVFAIGFAISTWFYWGASQAERAAAQRFVSLYEEQGRQELLQGAPTRAAVYLGQAYKLGAEGPSLRFLLARALQSPEGQEFSLEAHSRSVLSGAFNRAGTRVVTASSDNTAKIWDSLSGQLLATLQGHRNSVGSAVFSPDGSRIVTASQDRTAKVWEVATGRLLFSLEDHDKGLTEGAFSPRCQNRYRQLRHDRQSVGCAQWPAAGHTRRSLG